MRGKYLWIVLAVLAVVIVAGIRLPGSRVMPRGVVTLNISNARQLAMIGDLYATDHQGMYPRFLKELVPSYLDHWDSLLYLEIDSGAKPEPKYDWLYFAEGRDRGHLPHIIIASPEAVRDGHPNQRIVVYDDLSVAAIPEDQYQKELHQMIDKSGKTAEPIHPAAPRAGLSQNLADAKFLAIGAKLYASDHEGMYPVYLSELVPKYVDGEGWNHILYSVKPSEAYDWLYFGGGRDREHLPRIIIASPQALTEGGANKRVVAYNDGSGAVVQEEQYQREFHQMVEDVKKTPGVIPPASSNSKELPNP